MLFKKFLSFFRIKTQEEDTAPEELPENIIELSDFIHYRLKFNPDEKTYQKVLEYSDEDLN